MKTNVAFIISVCVIFILSSCKKEAYIIEPDETPIISNQIDELIISPDFDYKTTDDVTLTIKSLDNLNNPIKNVRFDVYTAHPDSGGFIMCSGATNYSGVYTVKFPLASFSKNLYVGTNYIGLSNMVKIDKNSNNLAYTFGGTQEYKKTNSGNIIFPKTMSAKSVPVKYLGAYTTTGVPTYLETPNDVLDGNFLNDINATLPEQRPVPTYNPEYLEQGNQTTLLVTQEADVWLTFVHEGAGYKNVLAFYVYPENDPPATTEDIDSLIVIFPNVSFYNSGGGLYSGNKVNIGRFQPGTKIGWALFQNAFNGTVNINAPKFYSDKWLNPEADDAKKQHNVLIMDPGRNLVLLGFEDLNRISGSDDDFNDAVFYLTSNPVEAINYSSMPNINYTDQDTDGDGVPDNFDDYPNDIDKAFNNYFPNENTYGSLAFEDLWPYKGDFDFNDMIIDYRFINITNAANEMVQLKADFYVKANGASYHNGFGFQLSVPPGSIENATGYNLTKGIVSLAGNGTELAQSKATLIVFDDAWDNFHNITGTNPQGSAGINTSILGKTGESDTIHLVVNFVNPINADVFGLAPYNPFIFINDDRTKELHLPDFPPTDLASPNFFGMGNDNSNPITGRYYKTTTNLPWAMNIINTSASIDYKSKYLKGSNPFFGTFSSFDYPTEKTQITQAHLFFANWAVSSGSSYKDWYKDLSGYRNNSNIYR